MGMSKLDLLLLLLVIIFTVAGFGGCAGYTVNGVPQGGISEEDPGLFGVVEWVWDSASFMIAMATFSVDDMPAWMSGIFSVISLMAIALVVLIIRGGGS